MLDSCLAENLRKIANGNLIPGLVPGLGPGGLMPVIPGIPEIPGIPTFKVNSLTPSAGCAHQTDPTAVNSRLRKDSTNAWTEVFGSARADPAEPW